MDDPVLHELQELSKETLIELIQIYSRNWVTVDGLWFKGVEEKYGLDAALKLDVKMWEAESLIEAKRIKKLFNLNEGGLEAIIKTINFMTWASSASPGYEYEISGNRAIWTCTSCVPQEKRIQIGKEEFPCKPTFEAMFNNIIEVIDPRVIYKCIFCPPDPRPKDAWCQWELTLPS